MPAPSAVGALLRTEARLTLRTPAAVVMPVLVPIVAMIVIAAVPAARRPVAPFGGLSVAHAYMPSLVIFSLTMTTLVVLPSALGGYRELGYLRRLRTTPASPAALLTAFLLLSTAVGLLAAGIITLAPWVFGVAPPSHPVTYTIGVLASLAAFLSVGTMLCAVIPNPRVAAAVGNVVAALMWFAAGLWYPRAQFPAWLMTLTDATPGGASARLLTDAVTGAPTNLWSIGVCVVWAVLGVVIAVRTFRWE
ncbi:MAG: ABC transporter permease [Mobilicoccus sp.]|nr:ABC transporter permease [Mobilicoccus sp.]